MDREVAGARDDVHGSFVQSARRQLRRDRTLFPILLAVLVIVVGLTAFEATEYSWRAHSVAIFASAAAALALAAWLVKRHLTLMRVSLDEMTAREIAEGELAGEKADLEETLTRFQQTNELLDRTFSSLNFLVAYMDRQFNFRWVNRAYAEADGHSPEFYPGKNHFDLFPDDDNRVIFQRVVESGEPYVAAEKPFEYAANPERGVTYWDWNCHPVKDSSNTVVGVALCLIDRTAQVRSRQDSAKAAETWQRTFDAIDDWVSIHTEDFRIVKANDAFCKGVHTDHASLSTRPCYELVHCRTRPMEGCVLTRAIATRAPASDEYFEPTLKRWFSVSAFPMDPGGDGPMQAVHVMRDMTAVKSAEEQLRQAQKMEAIGRLAGGVAHDFNNLLSVILGYTELLTDDQALPREIRQDVQEIHQAGKRAASLTRQLLAFSRRQVLTPEPIDVSEVVGSLEKMLGRLIGEDVRFKVVKAAGLPKAMLDRGQIEQVVLNLAVNARDAMPMGGSLTIETSAVVLDDAFARDNAGVSPGPHVMIAVSDTGGGMDEVTRARIFEPFFTTKEKGTGLGLSTVFGIVKQSRGSISVSSEPGRGTTFKIHFPVATQEVPAAAASSSAPLMPTGRETILLVEDDAQVRSLARKILAHLGYRVLTAAVPGEALDLVRRNGGAIDLLLTDVVMPGMGGRELARRVRALVPAVKVLYMSGYTDDAFADLPMHEAGALLVQKPITAETLGRRVREVLGQAVGVPRR